jgi:type I restriction enzyme S subunit
VNELPPGWAKATLGELGTYLNGRGFKKSEWRESGRPIIRIQNLTGSGSTYNYFQGEADERHVARDGELLVSWAATLGVYVWHGPEAVINQHIFKVESRIDRRFHRYLLTATLDDLQRQTHGSGMVHITKSKFDSTPVALPPLNEQRRIVAAIEEHLSRLDAADASLSQGVRRLDQLRRVASSEPFRGDWPRLPMSEVTDAERPIRYGILMPKDHVEDGVLYVKVRDYPRDKIELDGLKRTSHEIAAKYKRSTLREGDVLLAIRGTYGRVAVVPVELEGGNITQDTARIAPLESMDRRFLAAYLRCEDAQHYFRSVARGVAVKGVNIGDLRVMPIPVPPPEEQLRIVQEVEERLSRIDAMRASIERAQKRSKALREAILERAFRGELVPQDPSDEPAEALLARIRAASPSRRARL